MMSGLSGNDVFRTVLYNSSCTIILSMTGTYITYEYLFILFIIQKRQLQ
jgi:hypothetical protein